MSSRIYTYMIRMKSREGEVIEEVFLKEAESKRKLKELFETKFAGMRITASGKSLYYAKDDVSYWTIHLLKIFESVRKPKKKIIEKDADEQRFTPDEYSFLLVSMLDIPTSLMSMAVVETARREVRAYVLKEDSEHSSRLVDILNSEIPAEEKKKLRLEEIKEANRRNERRTSRVKRSIASAASKWMLSANGTDDSPESPQVAITISTRAHSLSDDLDLERLLLEPVDVSQRRVDEGLIYCISLYLGDSRSEVVLKYDTYAEAEECLSKFHPNEIQPQYSVSTPETASLCPEMFRAEASEEGDLSTDMTDEVVLLADIDEEDIFLIDTEEEDAFSAGIAGEEAFSVDATEEDTFLTEDADGEGSIPLNPLALLLSRITPETTSIVVSRDVICLSDGEDMEAEIKLFVYPKWMHECPAPRVGLGHHGRLVIETNEGVVIGNYLFSNYLAAQAYLMSGLGETFEKMKLIHIAANRWYLGEDVADVSAREYVKNKLWKYRICLVPLQ